MTTLGPFRRLCKNFADSTYFLCDPYIRKYTPYYHFSVLVPSGAEKFDAKALMFRCGPGLPEFPDHLIMLLT